MNVWKWNYEFIWVCLTNFNILFQIGNNPLTTTGAMDLVMAVSRDDSRVRLLDMIVCNIRSLSWPNVYYSYKNIWGRIFTVNTIKESKISLFFLIKLFIVYVTTISCKHVLIVCSCWLFYTVIFFTEIFLLPQCVHLMKIHIYVQVFGSE